MLKTFFSIALLVLITACTPQSQSNTAPCACAQTGVCACVNKGECPCIKAGNCGCHKAEGMSCGCHEGASGCQCGDNCGCPMCKQHDKGANASHGHHGAGVPMHQGMTCHESGHHKAAKTR